jgi:peptidoglycan/LPS O-acetylase OafA/YrhL
MRLSQHRTPNERCRDVLELIKTLFDIIRLRKGPDSIPHSEVLFAVIVVIWLAAGLVMMASAPELDARDFIIGTFIGIIGLSVYAAVIIFSGRSPRLLQAIMALLGCGALISLLFVALDALLPAVSSEAAASIVATLVLLWSVPVEGHIISRTIDRHWYVGIIIAMAVFVLQLVLYSLFDPTTASTA